VAALARHRAGAVAIGRCLDNHVQHALVAIFMQAGGGKAKSFLHIVRGAGRVAGLYWSMGNQFPGQITYKAATINGEPGLLRYVDGKFESRNRSSLKAAILSRTSRARSGRRSLSRRSRICRNSDSGYLAKSGVIFRGWGFAGRGWLLSSSMSARSWRTPYINMTAPMMTNAPPSSCPYVPSTSPASLKPPIKMKSGPSRQAGNFSKGKKHQEISTVDSCTIVRHERIAVSG
jgi:hypothetical protein